MGYEYGPNERIIMAIFTGISNFAAIPGITLMIIYDRNYEFFIGMFTAITSLLYHVCESLDYEFYMEHGKWHALDNIGSICCINSLLISLMNSYGDSNKQLRLNLFSLCFVLVMQAENPWDLFNTIFPIIVFGLIVLYDYYRNGIPKYNTHSIRKGASILIVAIAMFVKGLDDQNDYLRIAHSLWHVTIGINMFYLWQIQEKESIPLKQIFVEGYKRLA